MYLSYCFLLYVYNTVFSVYSSEKLKDTDRGRGPGGGGTENEEGGEGTFPPLIILVNNQDLISTILPRSS